MTKQIDAEISQESRQTIENTIIQQYTECTRLLNKLFNLAPDQCWIKDGIGCCDAPTGLSEVGLGGPAYFTLLRLRNARLAEEGLKLKEGIFHRPCSYHKEGVGCVLRELKSPLCIAFYCRGDLSSFDYGPNYVESILKQVLDGAFDLQTCEYHPERNWLLIQRFKSYISGLEKSVQYLNTRVI